MTIDGSMKTLVPDIAQHQTLALNRKFPRFNGVLGYSERMVNGVIEAAHHADFSDAIHVDSILRNPQMAYDTLHVYVSEAFRYWRFRADKDRICNVAELQFYNDSLCLNSVGTAIGATAISNTYAVEKAFDHIDVSYYEAAEHGGWIGLDFGESMPVNRIIYLPRNDDNNISVGDSYELIYWDATGYHSLGKKVAMYFHPTEYHHDDVEQYLLRHDSDRKWFVLNKKDATKTKGKKGKGNNDKS